VTTFVQVVPGMELTQQQERTEATHSGSTQGGAPKGPPTLEGEGCQNFLL